MTQKEKDEYYMKYAIGEAMKAKAKKDYGIGAVIIKDDQIICSVGNTRDEFPLDPTVHTETAVIRKTCEILQSRYLQGCTLYSTHAPCAMCLGACVWARISRVVYGTTQKDMVEFSKKQGEYAGRMGGLKWRGTEIEPEELYPKLAIANPNMEIVPCILREECKKLY